MLAPSQVSPSAEHEEVSRVVRASLSCSRADLRASTARGPSRLDLSGLSASLTTSQAERILSRLDTWAAFAVVVLASSALLCGAVWMLEHWQLR